MPVIGTINHIDILHQGVDEWNAWRENNPNEIPRLDGAYFPPEIYTGMNLKNASLRGAEFDESYLRLADLSGANLEGAMFHHVRLDDAYLERANLTNSQIICSNLQGAVLDGSNLTCSDLSRSNFIGASMVGADLTGANLTFCQLGQANLAYACLDGACIQDWAVTSETNFSSSECSHLFRKISSPQISHGSEFDLAVLEEAPPYSERIPVFQEFFAPGEFAKMVKTLCSAREAIEKGDIH